MPKINKIWESFTNQKQWKSYLVNLLKTNNNALKLSVVRIYDQQTFEEQVKKESIEENKVGFTKIDALFLGDIAEKVKTNQQLTSKELAILRNKMPKYWKQLMRISKAKIEVQCLEQQKQMEIYQREFERFEEQHQQEKIRCFEQGIPCSYGCCDECQMSL